MRAAAVLLVGMLALALPGLAQEGKDFFSITPGPFPPDSLLVNVHWSKPEKETVSLRILLMDFDGQTVREWQERAKLPPGKGALVRIGGIDPKMSGLDSGRAMIGVEARLSCGCETRRSVYHFKPLKDQSLTEPGLKAKIIKDKNGYLMRVSAKSLARQVRVVPRTGPWLVDSGPFDLLPGEETEVRLVAATPAGKPRAEDFILQSAWPSQQ